MMLSNLPYSNSMNLRHKSLKSYDLYRQPQPQPQPQQQKMIRYNKLIIPNFYQSPSSTHTKVYRLDTY
jgi:hypothetical protein